MNESAKIPDPVINGEHTFDFDFTADPDEGLSAAFDDFDDTSGSPSPFSHEPGAAGPGRGAQSASQQPMSLPGGGELMNLGLFEALPPFEVMEEL